MSFKVVPDPIERNSFIETPESGGRGPPRGCLGAFAGKDARRRQKVSRESTKSGLALTDHDDDQHETGSQLRGGPRRAARPRPRAGPGGAARLRRHRHVGDGDEPPLGRVRGHHPEGRGRPALARSGWARTTPSSSCRAGPRSSSRRCPRTCAPRAPRPTTCSPAHWSKAALKEAQKSGRARVAGSTESSGFDRVPAQGELDLDAGAAYLHFTVEQHDLRHAVVDRPRAPARRAARLRRILRRPQPARGRRAPRPPLRRRAEEPRPGRGDAGRSSGRTSSSGPRATCRPCSITA